MRRVRDERSVHPPRRGHPTSSAQALHAPSTGKSECVEHYPVPTSTNVHIDAYLPICLLSEMLSRACRGAAVEPLLTSSATRGSKPNIVKKKWHRLHVERHIHYQHCLDSSSHDLEESTRITRIQKFYKATRVVLVNLTIPSSRGPPRKYCSD